MSMVDTFAALMDELKSVIRQQIVFHVNTLTQVQTMAAKVDLYSAHEGKESHVGTSAGKGGRGSGKLAGQKGKLGSIEEGPQSNSVAMVAEKKSCKS